LTGNIILIGFSATGKSRVAPLAAQALGWEALDTDAQVEKLAGKPIPAVFAQEGEARFRQYERQVLMKALEGEKQVIAAGGGAILDPKNRERMRQRGFVVLLEARPRTILERLSQDPNSRPLLQGPDPLARIKELKARREPFYAFAHHTLPTDQLSLEVVAKRVARAYKAWSTPSALVRTPTQTCPIYVRWGGLEGLGELMRERGLGERAVVISDVIAFSHHGERVIASLEGAGFRSFPYTFPAGEESKGLETARRIYDFLVEQRAERGWAVVALGGGVVGDLAGFVAATYLRGLPLVQAPTSLVAMVDASIGGKVGVNHPQAKNLIGAFHQPHFVLADPSCLLTLPRRELVSGFAEVIKHGLILDKRLFAFVEARAPDLLSLEPPSLSRAVAWSARIKAKVVTQDERETTGLRTLLNYGHTIGHAVEAATGYARFLHGEAVAIGMTGAVRLSQRLGLVGEEVVKRQESLLQAFGLPTACPRVSPDRIIQAMELDKKIREAEVHWVLLEGIGRATTHHQVPQEDVQAVLQELTR